MLYIVEPVGSQEIAARLGVRRETVAMWRYRGLLPEPKWTVSGNPAWTWRTIEAWARASSRAPKRHRKPRT